MLEAAIAARHVTLKIDKDLLRMLSTSTTSSFYTNLSSKAVVHPDYGSEAIPDDDIARVRIKVDMLILLSESSILGCFLRSITDRDNQGEVTVSPGSDYQRA
jgi:hypothetical protein